PPRSILSPLHHPLSFLFLVPATLSTTLSFFFNVTAPTEIYTLSLHDALPILVNRAGTMVIPFLTLYLREEKNFSITYAGWEVAFFGIGAILGNFVGGRLTDKHGFYNVQFWCLFLNGILFIVLGQMQTFWQIGICMFVIGSVGEGFRPANAAAIAYYSLPENRTRSYSLNRLAINLGFSIGPAVGGLIAFKYLFWVDGITCTIAAVILRAALPEVKTGSSQKEIA